MKIAFVSRATTYIQPGGDTQQIENTAAELRLLGVDVHVITSGPAVDLSEYDIIHFFNIGRPADLIRHKNWKSKPLFVSTIWVEYPNSDAMETIKTLGRGILGNDLIPPVSYLIHGQRKSLEEVLYSADLLITTTQKEIDRLEEAFPSIPPTFVVAPGINRDYCEPLPEEKEDRNGVLVVGRFEEIKNQWTVIKALQSLNVHVTFVGDPAQNNPSYYHKCRKIASSNMSFRPHASMEALKLLYRSHKVVLIPSTFETFGLTALEGLSQKCNVVLSKTTGAYEVLKDYVIPIDPLDEKSIRSGVEAALRQPISSDGRVGALSYTWKDAAQTLFKLYQTRLNV